MTVDSQPGDTLEFEAYDQLVTPEFAPLAEFAGFCEYEAVAVQETGRGISTLIDRIPGMISDYLGTRPESTPLMGGPDLPVSEPLIKEWLDRTIEGPFDGELARFVREISHVGGKEVTFPGVRVPLPPQLVLALTAWLQGQILAAMGEIFDTATVSAAGAAWMNQLLLQLGIILEPSLAEPDAPMGRHEAAEFHPYAEFAGLGAKEMSILRKTGPLLGPAAGGVVTLAYDYLLSRPESAGYFQDASHLAERKMTLKGWWSKTTMKPMDGDFHAYMSRVADAHVKGGGTHPHVVIPADLTIALMGWVEMRVMTALNTVAPGADGEYVFGTMPEPAAAATVGQAWMRMLTLQLGILLKPYLASPV
ncbi:MAG: protoglobin family protein [Pseudonocardiales bacterium]|nr:protoglobin family protein [Pseudonocardiales bacterium]MBV9031519.1 protoglobin family protein [Pseudonocardiales bacterium]MBW0011126.1 protoglobin family protein [Pseudonocardiales bacterium]